MKPIRYFFLFLLLNISVSFALIKTARGVPATNFYQRDGDWYDNWGIDRNNAGSNGEMPGFLPNIAPETLGENKELAYSIGEHFLNQYESKTARADAILKFVQTWTYYSYDKDFKSMNGIPQEEWCQNADEFAHAFNQTTGVKAPGDCDCMATLCATIYTGAGFEAAVVDCTSHEGCLIWLPEYSNANKYWNLNDGKGEGWIWVEATGSENPVGWTPDDFMDGDWTAYPITNSSQFVSNPDGFEPISSSTSADLDTLIMIVVILFVVIILLIRLRHSH